MTDESQVPPEPQRSDRRRLAPLWHTAVLVLILLVVALGGSRLQDAPTAGEASADHHPVVMPLYFSLIVFELLLVAFVWFGLRQGGKTRISDLVGGRWKTGRDFLIDVGIAAGFWIVWMEVGELVKYLLGPNTAKSVDVLLPRGLFEVGTWIVLSITVGFCEEVVYRGYLQRQFLALTGSTAAAILIQGVLFGVTHGYQGTKRVITISVYGVLYGALASWRKSLRPGIISHGWSDIYGGFVARLF